MIPPIENRNSKIDDDWSTGLPLFTTWPAMYILVLAVFVLLVILLTLFTRAYA
jgi:hypothetical protein